MGINGVRLNQWGHNQWGQTRLIFGQMPNLIQNQWQNQWGQNQWGQTRLIFGQMPNLIYLTACPSSPLGCASNNWKINQWGQTRLIFNNWGQSKLKCLTNKVRLCERSEPQSEPVVGQARW